MDRTIDLTANTGSFTIVLASASIQVNSSAPMLVITPRHEDLVVNIENKEETFESAEELDESFTFCPFCPLTICDCGEITESTPSLVQPTAESPSEVSRTRPLSLDSADNDSRIAKKRAKTLISRMIEEGKSPKKAHNTLITCVSEKKKPLDRSSQPE